MTTDQHVLIARSYVLLDDGASFTPKVNNNAVSLLNCISAISNGQLIGVPLTAPARLAKIVGMDIVYAPHGSTDNLSCVFLFDVAAHNDSEEDVYLSLALPIDHLQQFTNWLVGVVQPPTGTLDTICQLNGNLAGCFLTVAIDQRRHSIANPDAVDVYLGPLTAGLCRHETYASRFSRLQTAEIDEIYFSSEEKHYNCFLKGCQQRDVILNTAQGSRVAKRIVQ